MAQKERELIRARIKAALAAAKARGTVLGWRSRGWRPGQGPDARRAAVARQAAAQRVAHWLEIEVERLRGEGVVSQAAVAEALSLRRVPAPSGTAVWTHPTAAHVLSRAG